jgi:hypothetical protein
VLRQANDVVGQVLIVVFLIVQNVTPLAILLLATINFVRGFRRRGAIILQALASLAIWLFLSYAFVMISFKVVISPPYPVPSGDDWKSAGLLLIAFLIYTFACLGLIYWTKVQSKLSRNLSAGVPN